MANLNEKKLTNMEISSFCGQMALILKSGISATEGVITMLEDSTDVHEKNILQGILDNLNMGMTLTDSLKETGLFPDYMLAMVKLGEETGTLDETMDSLSSYYEREEEVSRTVRNAIIYPAIMAIMMLIVIIVLLVFVLPIFNQVYAQLGTEMSGFSKVLLNIGTGLGTWGLYVIIALAAIAVIGLIASRFKKGAEFFGKIGYKLGFMKKTRKLKAISRLAGGLATGLKSGLDFDQSFELASDLNEEPALQDILDKCKKDMAEGMDSQEVLRESGLFSGVYSRMLSVGMKTGSAASVLERIADMNRDEVDSKMNNVLAALEPTIVIVLSVLVGIILLSVMLPLLGIISGI